MELTGHTILITGGASGIGWELTQQLHRRGNKIIVTGRDAKKLEQAKKQIPQIETRQNDVSQIDQLDDLYSWVTKHAPDVDVLINNAGIMKMINIHESAKSLDQLTEEIEINLMGPIRLANRFIPHFKTKKKAAIVNVTSGLAFVPLPISPVYCATKAGLHSFTLSLRVQLKNTSIKVFEFAPPATQTDLLGGFQGDDMKGISVMKVEDMVKECLKGMECDQYEIRPGQSNQLKFMSRLAPEFILKQLSRPVDRMLQNSKH